MADNILKAIITADGTEFVKTTETIKTSMQSLSGGITILQNQLDRLQKIASLPGLNVNQLNRIGGIINTTQVELTKLQSVASRVSPEFGKITNSTNELEKRIRIATSAEHEFSTLLGTAPAVFSGAENASAALGQEFLVLSTGIQRAREAGQSFGDIASTLASSVFSLQGIITLASAAIFAFGKEIFSSGDKTKQSAIEIEVYKQQLQELDKVLENLKGQFKFTDDVRKLNEELAKAGIDAGSLKGLDLTKAFDTKDSKAKISEIDSQVSLIDKDLENVNTKFKSLNSILEITKQSISDVQQRQAAGDPTAQLGKVSKDFALLFKNFGDLSKVTSAALGNVDPIVKTFVEKFQATTKTLDDLTTKRTELLRQKSAEQTSSQTKTIEDQTALDKKQAEIFSKQTDLLTQHLDVIKTTIETARKIQSTGDFAIPKALLIPDNVLQQVTIEGQKLIKQRQDLVSQLTKLDILEQQTGKDQTKAKASVQLEITRIDIKLNDQDFKNATEIIRERLNGLLRVAPISANIKIPVLVDETKKAEFEGSIKNLISDIKASVPIELTPEFNKDAENKLKEAIAQVDKAKGFDNLLRSMERVGQLGKIAGEETTNAFLKSGHSIEEATQAGANAEKQFNSIHKGLTQGAAESAKILDSVLTPAFQNLFSAILAGEPPLKAFFKSVEQSVAELITKLIAAAAEAAILSALSGGGTSFLSFFGKILGFAEGGRPPTGRPSIIGERGPELFVPDRPGVIIPNHRVKDFIEKNYTSSDHRESVVSAKTFLSNEKIITIITNNIDNSIKKWVYNSSIEKSSSSTSSTVTNLDKLISSFSYRSTGGEVTHNKPFVVGEKRAELFVPKTDGFIIPFVPNRRFDKQLIETLNVNKSIGFYAGGGSVTAGSQNIVGEFGPEAFFPNLQANNPQSGGLINGQSTVVMIPKLTIGFNEMFIAFNRYVKNQIAITGKNPLG